MKLVKSLAVATLIVGVASAQQEPNQAEWAKHVQQARARTRAYVDSGALDERKKAAQDRVSSFQHRGLEDAEDGDGDGNRHLQTIDGTRLPDGRFRSGTKAMRENALLRRKRLYSDGMWLIGRRVYRDYPHLMAGEEEDGEDYYYEDEGMGEVYEAADGEDAEDGAAPGQRALYSSDKFDARKDTYQARADASVNNAKNHKEKSKDRAKNSGWYPDQEAEAEAEEEEEAPADAEQKKAVADEGSDLSQASEMAGFDITDPTTKMTYVGKGAAYAASGVSRAVGRGATVAEREVDFAASRAELAYKNKQDNSKGRKLRGGRA